MAAHVYERFWHASQHPINEWTLTFSPTLPALSPADHCETPEMAYSDVAPLLEQLAIAMGKTKETIQIYECVFSRHTRFCSLLRKGRWWAYAPADSLAHPSPPLLLPPPTLVRTFVRVE
jgi:hypothetical protein